MSSPPSACPTFLSSDCASDSRRIALLNRFHIYIHDYCNKRGYTKTARELVNEADIPADSQPPINARQGLLFEWWSVFWTLFTAKNNGTGSDEALIYTQVGFFDLCYAFRFNDHVDPTTHPTVSSTATGSSCPESQPAPAPN